MPFTELGLVNRSSQEALVEQLLARVERLEARANGEWNVYNLEAVTGITLGNGTLLGKYVQLGELVVVQGLLTFGSTTSISGAPTFSVPITAAAPFDQNVFTGISSFYDSSAGSGGRYPGDARLLNSTRVAVMVGSSPATNPGPSNPFTWDTGDMIMFTIIYESAR